MNDFVTGDEFDPEVVERAETRRYEAVNTSDEQVKAYIAETRRCYTAVFTSGNSTQAERDFVLRDLTWFSKMDTHFFADIRVQDVHAGRKQVTQRIAEYTGLSTDTLVRRYIENQS